MRQYVVLVLNNTFFGVIFSTSRMETEPLRSLILTSQFSLFLFTVVRQNDPSLPDCPEFSCTDGSGDAAYNNMLINGCLNNCSSTECSADYKTLSLVHDLCDEDALSPLSELGLHDLEEGCAAQSCNIGSVVTDDQLVCNEEEHDECDCDGLVPHCAHEEDEIGCTCVADGDQSIISCTANGTSAPSSAVTWITVGSVGATAVAISLKMMLTE
jgi:hypothetical protein